MKQMPSKNCMKQPVMSKNSSKASTGNSNTTCFKCGAQEHKSFKWNTKNTQRVIITKDNAASTIWVRIHIYIALLEAAIAIEDDYDEEEEPLLCMHDACPSLVATWVLTTQALSIGNQWCNIFQTWVSIEWKSIKVIIDGRRFPLPS